MQNNPICQDKNTIKLVDKNAQIRMQ